ncbi:MAG: hypothetical protein P8Y69_03795 [Gammaproteobacteria bacterium]
MLLAPAAGLLGILPFIVRLNLSVVQYLLVTVGALIVCYVGGLILGAPGYLILRRLGYTQTRHLIAYAAVLVLLTPIVLNDVYALLSFGPPILLGAAAFCLLRGPAIQTSGA